MVVRCNDLRFSLPFAPRIQFAHIQLVRGDGARFHNGDLRAADGERAEEGEKVRNKNGGSKVNMELTVVVKINHEATFR